MRTVYLVHPAVHRITKFFPGIPLERGDTVLVEGVEGIHRCRVVNQPKIDWSDETEEDGHHRWWLRGLIKVVPNPCVT